MGGRKKVINKAHVEWNSSNLQYICLWSFFTNSECGEIHQEEKKIEICFVSINHFFFHVSSYTHIGFDIDISVHRLTDRCERIEQTMKRIFHLEYRKQKRRRRIPRICRNIAVLCDKFRNQGFNTSLVRIIDRWKHSWENQRGKINFHVFFIFSILSQTSFRSTKIVFIPRKRKKSQWTFFLEKKKIERLPSVVFLFFSYDILIIKRNSFMTIQWNCEKSLGKTERNNFL